MRRVRSLAGLFRLAQQKRAVISEYGPLVKPKPAAFVLAWQGRMIYYAIKRGLYVYERKSK